MESAIDVTITAAFGTVSDSNSFAPIDIDGQQYASVHGENENIGIDKLPLAVDFYKALIKGYPAGLMP